MIAVREHMAAAIEAAPIQPEPWAHCVVRSVFPEDYYQALLEHLPSRDLMHPLSQRSPYHYMLVLQAAGVRQPVPTFWEAFREWFLTDIGALLQAKFQLSGGLLGGEVVCDVPRYTLGPHTDMPDRLATAIFYLTGTPLRAAEGTVLYRSARPDPDGLGHTLDEPFEPVARVPYLPNVALLFQRTDWSYHGVESVSAERWSLACNLFKGAA